MNELRADICQGQIDMCKKIPTDTMVDDKSQEEYWNAKVGAMVYPQVPILKYWENELAKVTVNQDV